MSSRKPTNPIDPELAAIYRREKATSAEKTGGHGGAIALTIVVLLAVVVTALFPGRQEITTDTTNKREDTGLNAIVCENSPELGGGDRVFWQWIHLLEPTQWYYPTKEGFSRYNDFAHFNSRDDFNGLDCLRHEALAGYTLPQNPLPPPEPSVSSLEAELPAMSVSDFMDLPILLMEKSSDGAKASKVITARWRRVGGGMLAESPVFTEEEQELLNDSANWESLLQQDRELLEDSKRKNCYPTRLEVQFLPEILHPRVLIRESCGNHQVDLIALHALQRILKQRLDGQKPFNHLASVFLEVDWRM